MKCATAQARRAMHRFGACTRAEAATLGIGAHAGAGGTYVEEYEKASGDPARVIWFWCGPRSR